MGNWEKDAISVVKSMDLTMGDNCEILCNPYNAFASAPYLISIGDHVKVTSGCRFITHDGGAWVIRQDPAYKDIELFGNIVIGNVFIGINATVMPGVSI